MDHVLQLRHWLAGPDAPVTGPVRLTLRAGSIAAIDPAAPDPAGRRLFAMPCLVNAHDHARPLRSSSFGAGGKPLEIWLHYLALLPAMDPYTVAAAALGRGALGGCGIAMIHHTRVQGLNRSADRSQRDRPCRTRYRGPGRLRRGAQGPQPPRLWPIGTRSRHPAAPDTDDPGDQADQARDAGRRADRARRRGGRRRRGPGF